MEQLWWACIEGIGSAYLDRDRDTGEGPHCLTRRQLLVDSARLNVRKEGGF